MTYRGQKNMLQVEALLADLDRRPEQVLLWMGDREVTAGEFRSMIYRAARALGDRGLGRDDGVAVLEANTPEVLAVRIGAELAGCRTAVLYRRMAPTGQVALLDTVRAALFVLPADAPARELTGRPVCTTEELLAHPDDSPLPARCQVGDVGQLRFTGGTTGLPKTIVRRHVPRPEADPALPNPFADGIQLLCTPYAHAGGGLLEIVLAMNGGGVLLPSFDAHAVAAAIEKHRVTNIWLLPTMLYELAEVADQYDLSSLRMVLYGGWRAAPDRLRQAAAKLGPVLFQFYGQNEAGGISMLYPADHLDERRAGTVGTAMPGVEIEIRNGGEIWVRSAMVMDEYWENPELTALTLVDGWLHTGDRGFLDPDGYLTISGRTKEMIIVSGGHVYPRDVEEVLLTHPAVSEAVVFGVLGADGAESVHAAVVGAGADPAELVDWVVRHRGEMYRPRAVLVLDELPLTAADKPDVRRLTDLVLSL
ncbi:fatty acid--CoA ligase [Pseudonocardiaceae bacterium YIM PH 21723]|nr:fatty acid--CoA ligase [Pseudonocardiaceae bacterium YIM PH 21723]